MGEKLRASMFRVAADYGYCASALSIAFYNLSVEFSATNLVSYSVNYTYKGQSMFLRCSILLLPGMNFPNLTIIDY